MHNVVHANELRVQTLKSLIQKFQKYERVKRPCFIPGPLALLIVCIVTYSWEHIAEKL